MKRFLLLFCLLSSAAYSAVTISHIRGEQVSHSDMILKWDMSGSQYNDGTGNVWFGNAKVLWTNDGTSCLTSGTAHVFLTGYGNGDAGSSGPRSSNTFQIILAGLYPAGSLIHVCPNINANGTWYNAETTIQLQSAPAIHPARPIAPRAAIPTYPNTTGWNTVSSSCANITNDFNTALGSSTGTVITIPAGSVCDFSSVGPIAPNKNQYQTDVTNLGGSPLSNDGSGNMLVTWNGHGLAEGQGLHFTRDNYPTNLPGESHNWTCTGIDMGRTYYVHNPTANTFLLTCDDPYSAGGSVMTYQSGSFSALLVAKYPRTVPGIIIRTSTPDSQFAPPGTMVNPNWLSLMVQFKTNNQATNISAFFQTKATTDTANFNLLGKVWLVGIQMVGPPINVQYGNLWGTTQDSDDIVFDRCIFDGSPNGYPNGYNAGPEWDGSNQAIINSYFRWQENGLDSAAGDTLHGNGMQAIQAELGPGPYIFSNNHVEYFGNFLHFTDDGNASSSDYNPSTNTGTFRKRWDYLITRNNWIAPMQWCQGSPVSDGHAYGGRSPIEWKSGHRIKLVGNVFGGLCHGIASVTAEFTSVDQWGVSDVEMAYNTIAHAFAGAQMGNSTQGGKLQSPPINRFWTHDNIFYDLDGETFKVPSPAGLGHYTGFAEQAIADGEDQVFEHNLLFKLAGTVPVFLRGGGYVEGAAIRNNILYVTNGYSGYSVEPNPLSGSDSCGSSVAEAGLLCHYPSLDISGNLLISDAMTQAALQGIFPNAAWRIPSDPTNTSLVGWTQYAPFTTFQNRMSYMPDFHLKYNSSYISGGSLKATDGKDVGPDMEALLSAQGHITSSGVYGVTTTGANVAFVAPDTNACSVDFSSSDPNVITSFTRVNGVSGNRSQTVAVTGLTPHTPYSYRINCAVEQPIGLFRTQ